MQLLLTILADDILPIFLSAAAIPTMLLVLGMQLERSAWPARPGLVAAASVLTLAVTPVLGFALAALLGLAGGARQAVIVESAMPNACSEMFR